MSDRPPPGEGFGTTPEDIERMLRDVREALKMDVAFVSQFASDRLVFRAIEGDAESFGWREGQSFPLDESDAVLREPRARPLGSGSATWAHGADGEVAGRGPGAPRATVGGARRFDSVPRRQHNAV
jgi:hypothetical protein